MYNILFLVADALRADHLGCYGYTKNTTPFIDTLAKEGCLFKNVISNCNHTLPGIVSIFTGLYQNKHGLHNRESYKLWKEGKILTRFKSPLSILEKNGYFVSGFNPDIFGKLGYSIGIENLKKSLEENKDKNFFMWWWLEFTHLPYNPPEPYDKMFLSEKYKIDKETEKRLNIVKTKMIIHRPGFVSAEEKGEQGPIQKLGYDRTFAEIVFSNKDIPFIVSLYDGEVRLFDIEVEKYVKILEVLGILDKTIIVITADHGEQLLERGALGHSSCSLEGNLYDENIKVPLIIRCPDLIPKGKVIEKQVSQVDIMPTILDMVNIKPPIKIDGQSLMPLIRGEKSKYKEECFAMTEPAGWQKLKTDERMIYCIRTPKWKLIYNYDPQNKNNTYYELYNLEKDPEEKNNLINKNLKVETQLKRKLRNWIKRENIK